MGLKVWILVGLVAFKSTAAAEVGAHTVRLSLAQAQRLALQRNADLRAAEAQAEMARAQLRAAREFPNPVLGWTVGKINTDRRSNATPEGGGLWDRSYDTVFTLGQLIEIGKRKVRQDSAGAAARAAQALRDDVRRLLLTATGQLYCAALEAREEMRVEADSATSLREEAAIGAARLQAGDIAASDQAQLEISATQLDLAADSARAGYKTAVLALESLLGSAAPQADIELTDTLPDLAARTPVEADGPAAMRPDLEAAEAAVAKSEADVRLQRRANVPDLTLALEYEHQPPDQPNTVGVGISFPVPFWNQNRGGIQAAQAAREQASAQLDKVRTQAAAEISGGRIALAEARARLEAYRGRLEPNSASVVSSIEYSYQQGGASLVELLAAERNDNDIRIGGARARADAASAAIALAAALNQLDVADSGVEDTQPTP